MLLEILIILGSLAIILWYWGNATFKTFEERGIPHEKPAFLVGNTKRMFNKNFSFARTFVDFYNRNKHHKVVGYYHLRSPFYMINDPDLIKKIGVKDFDVFRNHFPFIQTYNEPLWDRMVMNMEDQTWKDMRNSLTPAFTANKMRTMFTLMEESFEVSLNYLRSLCKDGKPTDVEMKECFTRLSNDIIASTAFGLKLNSYEDRDNDFYKIGQTLTNFRGKQIVKLFVLNLSPWFAKIFRIKMFDSDKCKYFTKLVVDTMEYRKKNNILRPDMIQLLMEAQNDSGKEWSEVDVVAQCFIFFFAAFENNANLISLSCYELMRNPDEQQRLYEEALSIQEELNGKPLTYDVVSKMEYMDMVVSEVLRKWSFSILTNRLCSKDYQLKDDDDNLVCEFKKGDIIWFPLLPLSLDDQYFEEPHKFNPERFSPENKDKIKPGTYLPFGIGPRNCIGNRYAFMQGKAMLYHLILNFTFEKCEKSGNDLYEDLRGFNLMPKDGLWARFVPRKH